jgi:ribosomal protein L16 Arg81 hydroxylase
MIVNKEYSNYEFTSPLDIWNPQEQYKNGFLKMKFLDFVFHPGHVLYIPPFWFYSIKFEKDNRDVIVHEFNYGSVMNVVSNSANLAQHFYKRVVAPMTSGSKKKPSVKNASAL